MKKTIVILLAFCLCVGLCACASDDETTPTNYSSDYMSDYTSDYTPKGHVGVWVANNFQDIGPYSFRLLENGKALIQMEKNNWTVEELPWAVAGEWMVTDDQLILFYELDKPNSAYDSAYIFVIESENEVILNGMDTRYSKK